MISQYIINDKNLNVQTVIKSFRALMERSSIKEIQQITIL